MPRRQILRSQQIYVLIVLLATTVEVGCRQSAQLPPEIQKQLVANGLELESDSQPASPTANIESSQQPEKPELCLVSDVAWIREDQLPWSYSEVQYVGNTRVGFSTVTVDRSDLKELKQLRILREDTIDRATDGSMATQRSVSLEILESQNGEMASFRFDSKIGGDNELYVEGYVVFDNLELTRREGKERLSSTRKIPWKREHWGPFGIQSSLMRSPMKTGEIRSAQVFIPQLAQFVPVVFEAKSMELTPLSNGQSQELLQIDLTIGTSESGMLATLFVDQTGVIWKSITRSGQPMLAMQVPAETVQRIADQSHFSRGIALRVKVTGALNSSPQAAVARFFIDAESVDPFDILLAYNRQRLNSINADRCKLTIITQSESQSEGRDSESKPDASMLENSLLIPTEKEATTMLVGELLDGQSISSDTQKAEALRSALHRVWKFQPIKAEIASTLVSARDRSGSCIEGSHVLAALLRHEKIASKLVCGLLIDPATSESQFHVWNQAWLDQRWVDLDVSIPGPVGALHIAMSATAGSSQNPYSHFLKVMDMIAQIQGIGLQASE